MCTRKEKAMKKVFSRLHALIVCVLLVTCPLVRASAAVAMQDQRFSNDELDQLLSPIALYPDPLLAQLVPAATFFDQLQEANQLLGGRSDDNAISNQSWDVSVKSVAHYPQVLQKMVQDSDWTIALGQAYVNQSTDVAKSIQRLRAEARSAGSLVTTSQQQVIVEGDVIRIVPAQPQVIYVPQYNPEVVYVDSGPSTGTVIAAAAISFGAGLAIGAWLNNDWDWRGRGIYYHGWVGGGWVGVNRSFVNVNVNRNVYINNRYNHVNLNRNITTRNINSYRTNLNRNATVRRNNITRNNVTRNNINRNDINRNNINRNDINRNNANRNDINRNNANRNDINRNDVNRNQVDRNEALKNRTEKPSWMDRGRQTQNTTPRRDTNSSAFGGGGNRAQIQQDRNRGTNSMNRMGAGGGGQQRNIGGGGGARKPSGGGGLRKRG